MTHINPVYFRILKLLDTEKDINIYQISRKCEIAFGYCYQMIAKLEKAGLIFSERDGRQIKIRKNPKLQNVYDAAIFLDKMD